MKKRLFKISKAFFGVSLICLFSVFVFAQTQIQELTLKKSIDSEIKGGQKHTYTVKLKAGQTALIEAIQNGVDINFSAINLKGEEFIVSLSPSGLYGEDSILVTAKETGHYKVEVSTASPRARLGKYKITLSEIRPTVEEDFAINDAARMILSLAQEATKLKYEGTIEGKQKAIAKWDEAIEVSKIKKDVVWEGVALVGQGLIYEQLGELQKALDVYLISLVIWEDINNRQYKASSINNIGNVYADIGEYEKAIDYYKRALKLQREVGDMNSVATYLNNIGYAYMRLQSYTEAESFFKQSVALRSKNQSVRGKRSLGYTLNNLGANYLLKGEQEKGIDFLERSLKVRQEVKHSWGVANSLINLGKAQWEAGNKDEGLAKLNDANRRSKALGDRVMEAQSFYLLARAEKELGNIDTAIENITKGLDLIEQIRSSLVSSESRYSYFSTVQNYYDLYIDLLISRSEKTKQDADVALALQISERSRSRSLVELLQEAKVDFRQSVDAKLFSELKNAQKKLTEKYAGRQRLLSGKPKPEQVTKINNEINDLNTKIQNLQITIRRENPRYADLTEGKTISAKEIQSLLDEDTVLIQYKLGDKRSLGWLVTSKNVEVFNLPDRKTIEEKARSFYSIIIDNKKSEKSKIDELSKELGDILLSPVANKITNKRLAVVADGILQYTPFSALSNPALDEGRGKYLSDTNEIIVLPSASVLAQIRSNPSRDKIGEKTIAIFADPVFDKQDSRISEKKNEVTLSVEMKKVTRDFRFGETLPRLIYSRREAKNIADLIDKNRKSVRTDFEASVKNIEKENLKDYKILHFATHGLLNTNRPELSGLVFSLYDKNGNTQNGFLSLNDIYNLDLSSDMVVLSACQTALGKDVRGEGLIGLSRGFLYAGSNRIVASLWKVDDSATAEFMMRFYKHHLEEGMSAAKSLQQTKLEMKNIKRYQSPYYWSAFTLLGDWK